MLRDRLRQLLKSETQDSVCKLLYKCFLKTLESVPYPMFPPFFLGKWPTEERIQLQQTYLSVRGGGEPGSAQAVRDQH